MKQNRDSEHNQERMTREEVPIKISEHLDGRLVRWSMRGIGYYHGRAVEVLHAEAKDQLELTRRFGTIRKECEQAAGHAIVLIFLTPKQSDELLEKERLENEEAP